jgi:hypothetical protein
MEPKVNKGYPAGRKVGDINRRLGGIEPVPQAPEPEKCSSTTRVRRLNRSTEAGGQNQRA